MSICFTHGGVFWSKRSKYCWLKSFRQFLLCAEAVLFWVEKGVTGRSLCAHRPKYLPTNMEELGKVVLLFWPISENIVHPSTGFSYVIVLLGLLRAPVSSIAPMFSLTFSRSWFESCKAFKFKTKLFLNKSKSGGGVHCIFPTSFFCLGS